MGFVSERVFCIKSYKHLLSRNYFQLKVDQETQNCIYSTSLTDCQTMWGTDKPVLITSHLNIEVQHKKSGIIVSIIIKREGGEQWTLLKASLLSNITAEQLYAFTEYLNSIARYWLYQWEKRDRNHEGYVPKGETRIPQKYVNEYFITLLNHEGYTETPSGYTKEIETTDTEVFRVNVVQDEQDNSHITLYDSNEVFQLTLEVQDVFASATLLSVVKGVELIKRES